MTLIRHEIKQGGISLIVWTVSIAFLLVICVLLYPEMKGEMDGMSEMFSSMGSFTQAFGMDKINFGTLKGFYAVECGNILGLGGAFFSSLCAAAILSKEEKDHTAEFLFAHPCSRAKILSDKLIAVFLQIVILNLLILVSALISIAAIGEDIMWKELLLLHLAYFLLQAELAGICFGVSAFLRKGSLGIGLGIASIMYFLNLVANISDKAGFLKYITPFGYAEGTDIMTTASLDEKLVIPGLIYGLAGIVIAYWWYCRKDLK